MLEPVLTPVGTVWTDRARPQLERRDPDLASHQRSDALRRSSREHCRELVEADAELILGAICDQ
ncbi:hypothetical protein [Rhodococcus sp. OK302]|uniref:hypothetical protein n=1 Tax=Rhodococcus sp. OK302 TaxID=1882769 RepID=UPI000B9449BE|nr:hypothetical protein [Rhodococcus sp. OK302]OYD60981.1 hypothetical protein BDB13_5903 [Rhodococcus sp. OK302]